MKNPFKDPIAYSKREVPFSYDDRVRAPFKKPSKEQATTGRFMQMGDEYGVGYRTPVGKEKPRNLDQGPILQNSECYNPDEMIRMP
jgi:hypothetical protein